MTEEQTSKTEVEFRDLEGRRLALVEMACVSKYCKGTIRFLEFVVGSVHPDKGFVPSEDPLGDYHNVHNFGPPGRCNRHRSAPIRITSEVMRVVMERAEKL